LNDPIEGLEVEELDQDAYMRRMRDLPRVAEEIMDSLPPDLRLRPRRLTSKGGGAAASWTTDGRTV
jgi:hypothetical protein